MVKLHALIFVLPCLMPGPGAWAQDAVWMTEKCSLYSQAWTTALDAFDTSGMSEDFRAGNEAFLAAGCVRQGDICPRSSADFDVANALSLALINAGAASTFLPFHCPRPEAVPGGWTGPGL